MIISWPMIKVTVSRNNFILNREKKTAEGCVLNVFLKRQKRKSLKILARVQMGYLKSGPPA